LPSMWLCCTYQCTSPAGSIGRSSTRLVIAGRACTAKQYVPAAGRTRVGCL
jgi:hypothetical protein